MDVLQQVYILTITDMGAGQIISELPFSTVADCHKMIDYLWEITQTAYDLSFGCASIQELIGVKI